MHPCSTQDLPLIGRLNGSNEPTISLSGYQLSAVSAFREAVRKGTYGISPHPCLCGGRNDLVVARRDRYGLDVRTVLCRSCGLLRTDPYFDEASMRRFYERDYRGIYATGERSLEAAFDRQVAHGKEIARFLESAGISIGGRVLEVGCGAGGILREFQKRSCRVAGCDFESGSLDYGRRQGLSLQFGDPNSLMQYAPARLIILSHVLEHFREPVGELRKIRSLLDKEGYVYIEVPGLFNIERAYDRSDLGRYLQNAHAYHFCLESTDYVMSLAGFSRIEGNERVCAVYFPANRRLLPPRGLDERTVKHLKRLERHRRYRILRSQARSLISVGRSKVMAWRRLACK